MFFMPGTKMLFGDARETCEGEPLHCNTLAVLGLLSMSTGVGEWKARRRTAELC